MQFGTPLASIFFTSNDSGSIFPARLMASMKVAPPIRWSLVFACGSQFTEINLPRKAEHAPSWRIVLAYLMTTAPSQT